MDKWVLEKTFLGGSDVAVLVLVVLETGFVAVVAERVLVGFAECFEVAVLRCPEAMDVNEKEVAVAAEAAIEASIG